MHHELEDQLSPLPESFLALYPLWRGKRTESLAHIRQRYDLCEDLCQQLLPGLQALHDDGIGSEDLLDRCEAGMASPESGLSSEEARWVVTRIAELAGWTTPPQT
jgi:hypothetical protein